MAKIAIDRAPSTALPRRFLLCTPVWGAVAGLLLAVDGELALQTRWAPATLAIVHALTLGLLGNAMFGSLLQFLPAAAGVRLRGGTRGGWLLFGLLNVGTLLLVCGFRFMRPSLLIGAAAFLTAAFGLMACMVVPGLVACVASRAREASRRAMGRDVVSDGQHDRGKAPSVRPAEPCDLCTAAGIGLSVIAALGTAALGVAMLMGLTTRHGLPVSPWVDVHAAWGVLGWSLGLLTSVGAVVVPMFQGTRALPPRYLMAWMLLLAAVLQASPWAAFLGKGTALVRVGGATCMVSFALAGLWLQYRAVHARNPWLVRSWRMGFLALLAAAGFLVAEGSVVLLGVLVLAIALPWFVVGMQLEIVAFLGWIELHRRCGRGLRLPSVQTLLPETHKAGVFTLQALAASLLLGATLWPTPAFVRIAGAVLVASYAVLWLCLHRVKQRTRAFEAVTREGAHAERA